MNTINLSPNDNDIHLPKVICIPAIEGLEISHNHSKIMMHDALGIYDVDMKRDKVKRLEKGLKMSHMFQITESINLFRGVYCYRMTPSTNLSLERTLSL